MMRTGFVLSLLMSVPLVAANGNAATTNTIVMKNFDFSPMTLSVRSGATVTWKNLDGEPHTVVSVDGKFRSPALDQNDSFSYKFDTPGTYKYLCSIHPKMTGTITVTAEHAGP